MTLEIFEFLFSQGLSLSIYKLLPKDKFTQFTNSLLCQTFRYICSTLFQYVTIGSTKQPCLHIKIRFPCRNLHSGLAEIISRMQKFMDKVYVMK